jgi:hypothetical protein
MLRELLRSMISKPPCFSQVTRAAEIAACKKDYRNNF